MANQVAPTKNNLMAAKKSLKLARMGYDLLGRKKNILVREIMDRMQEASGIQEKVEQAYAEFPEFKNYKFNYTYVDGLQREITVSVNNDVQNVLKQLSVCP